MAGTESTMFNGGRVLYNNMQIFPAPNHISHLPQRALSPDNSLTYGPDVLSHLLGHQMSSKSPPLLTVICSLLGSSPGRIMGP